MIVEELARREADPCRQRRTPGSTLRAGSTGRVGLSDVDSPLRLALPRSCSAQVAVA
jgi:hypothetical protein